MRLSRFAGLRRRLSYANVMATLALFVALGGTSVAATKVLLPRNSVGTRQVINGSLHKVDLNRKTIAALHGARGTTGPPGAAGPKGPTGLTGPAGTVASLDDLNGKPCSIRGQAGIVHLLKPVAKRGFSVSMLCLRADEWEPNDSLDAAVDLTSESGDPANTLKFVAPSIYPAGDNDFFKLTHIVDFIFLGPVSSSEPVKMNVYKDNTLVASNVSGEYDTGDATSHTWVVQVFAAPTLVTGYSLQVGCGGTC